MQSWDLHARAVLKLKAEVYNIGIRWQYDARHFMLLLEAPFGQGVIRIDSTLDGGYHLRLPGGRIFSNDSPERLLDEVVGWSLPIGGLEYWIRGLPRPDSDYSHSVDNGGRPRSIRQDRWSIDYLDYFAMPVEAQLPRRITLQREELTLKLVIERWQQSEAGPTPPGLFPEFN